MTACNLIPLLEDKLKFLEQLLTEGKEILYHVALVNLDELTKTGQYQSMKRYLDGLAQKKDWN